MRWWLFVLILLAMPCVHAVTGWYYAGDTFKQDGVLYAVEGGFDYDKVLLSVGGRSYVITLGDCITSPTAKYCYSDTAYPDDETHIKYQSGKQYYGYYLSIDSLVPKISVSRTISSSNPSVGDQLEVAVTFSNTGDLTVDDLTYAEAMPAGISYISGPGVETGSVVYKIPSLSPSDKPTLKYYIRPKDYVNVNLVPNISYSYHGMSFNTTATALSIVIATPLASTSGVTSTLNLDETGSYSLNLSNIDKALSMTVNVNLSIPDGLHVVKAYGVQEKVSRPGYYEGTFTLGPGQNGSVFVTFKGGVSGTFKIPADIVAEMDKSSFKKHFEATVTTKADKLNPTIKLSSNRPTYRPGDPLTISGILENVNQITTFKTISGKLSGPGLFTADDFSHEAFPPKKVLTELEKAIVIPPVNESKTFHIAFSGDYATPAGETYSFSTTKDITVAPIKQIVTITKTLDPVSPAPGGNVTVTVTAQNVYNQYVSFTTHESYDPRLTRVGGIIYSENSLDRDAQKQLYIYQLAIPANYTESSFNLTTEVTVKDEGSTKFMTTVQLSNVTGATNVAVNQTANGTTTGSTTTGTETTKAAEKPGFFTQVWNFLKRLF